MEFQVWSYKKWTLRYLRTCIPTRNQNHYNEVNQSRKYWLVDQTNQKCSIGSTKRPRNHICLTNFWLLIRPTKSTNFVNCKNSYFIIVKKPLKILINRDIIFIYRLMTKSGGFPKRSFCWSKFG